MQWILYEIKSNKDMRQRQNIQNVNKQNSKQPQQHHHHGRTRTLSSTQPWMSTEPYPRDTSSAQSCAPASASSPSNTTQFMAVTRRKRGICKGGRMASQVARVSQRCQDAQEVSMGRRGSSLDDYAERSAPSFIQIFFQKSLIY